MLFLNTIVYCIVASGTRLSYFEGKIRVTPVSLSPAGLTRLSLSPRCAWTPVPDTAERVQRLRGRRRTGEAAWSYLTLLFPVIKTSAPHSSLIFLSFFFFFILPTDGLSLDIGRGGEEARGPTGLLSDGAPGLRELRAHGGPGVNDAGGWTLLPGKDGM